MQKNVFAAEALPWIPQMKHNKLPRPSSWIDRRRIQTAVCKSMTMDLINTKSSCHVITMLTVTDYTKKLAFKTEAISRANIMKPTKVELTKTMLRLITRDADARTMTGKTIEICLMVLTTQRPIRQMI